MASPSGSPRRSPLSPKAPVATTTAVLQIQQFLDDWHYHVMHTSLGKEWTRRQAVGSALDLLALSGVQITAEDAVWFCDQPEEIMVSTLAQRLPLDMRENLDELTQQLKLLLLTASNIRRALDSGNADKVVEEMEETDHSAIKDQILKHAVVKAGKDVAHLFRCQDTWVKTTERRLTRLTRSAENAAAAQQQLLRVEAALQGFGIASKAKVKKALHGFCEFNEQTGIKAVFSQWASEAVRTARERTLRKGFEQELEEKEIVICRMKEKAISNVRHCVASSFAEGESSQVAVAFAQWVDDVASAKHTREEDAVMARLRVKLDATKEAARAKASLVMTRMASDVESALVGTGFIGWRQGATEQKARRQLDEEVDAKAAQMQQALRDNKAVSKRMLAQMCVDLTDTLLRSAVTSWAAVTSEEKAVRKLKDLADDKILNVRKALRKSSALGCQERVSDQLKCNTMYRCLSAWDREAKLNRIDRYYKDKMDMKRKQLGSVQTLFRKFADKLEEGLNVNDGDSSGRALAPIKKRQLSKGGNFSVSLPDIHAKQ